MSMIRLNNQLKRVEIDGFEIDNEIVFEYFKKVAVKERKNTLIKAIYIGVLGLMEDRLSAFLAKTSNELGTELESLKLIFDMKHDLFYKTAIKGVLGEKEICDFLNEFITEKRLKDKVYPTGNKAGMLDKNKTGDIVSEINGNSEIRISIECKFDKNIKMGEIDSKEIFTKKMETAWNQLLEAQVNRESRASLIVFDKSLIDNSIYNAVENVGYIHGIGLISVIDSQKGDYSNLAIAYMLARDIAINSKDIEFEPKTLEIIIKRIVKNLSDTINIKKLIDINIENNKAILKQIEKSMLLFEFDKEYLLKFLREGNLTKKDLLDYYMAEEVKDKYKLIENEIQNQ